MSTCHTTQKKPPNTESDDADDKDEQGEALFRPMMEQFGSH